MGKSYQGLLFNEQTNYYLVEVNDVIKDLFNIHKITTENKNDIIQAFVCGCFLVSQLKEQDNSLSLNVKINNQKIFFYGNGCNQVKGYFFSDKINDSSITVIKDLNLKEPYTGSCFFNGCVLDGIVNYYKLSEQQELYYKMITKSDKIYGAFFIPMPYSYGQRELINNFILNDNFIDNLIDNSLLNKDLQFKCLCSKKQIESVLFSVGLNDLHQILKEQKTIDVSCEYCNKKYSFNKNQIDKLFKVNND